MLSHYGHLPIRIIKADTLATVRPYVAGWFTQQIYKLVVAKEVITERYIVLDAKTHLVAPLNRTYFDAPNGKIYANKEYYMKHPLRHYLLGCCEYYLIEPKLVMNGFLPTTPPFTMITKIVKDLMKDIEKWDGRSFPEAFLARRFTEFFLYGTYILSTGRAIEDYYEYETISTRGLWKEDDNPKMQRKIKETELFLSVHRNCFKSMNAQTQDMLANLWLEQRLFASHTDALRFVKGCAETYAKIA